MRKILPLILASIVAAVVPSAAAAAVTSTSARPATTAAGVPANEARFGGSRSFGRRPTAGTGRSPFGTRRSPSGTRRSTGRRSTDRPFRRASARRFFGGVLRTLGILYLVHALFGWGAGGGSPVLLFVLIGMVVLWMATRRRRPR